MLPAGLALAAAKAAQGPRRDRRWSQSLGCGRPGITTAETPADAEPAFSDDFRAVVRFVVPALGTAMLGPTLDATNAAIVGRFGSVVDLAALSPSMAACDLFGLLFTFLSATTVNAMAKARGRRDEVAARRTLSDACCLAVCCGLAISISVLVFCGPLLRVLISPAALPAVAGPASAYMRARAVAFPAQMLQLVLSAACFSALQDTVTPLRASAYGGLVGLTLNFTLIACCGLGCVGAALGTAGGQFVAVALLVRALRCHRGFPAGTAAGETGAAPDKRPLLADPTVWVQSLRPARMLPLLAFAAPFLAFQLMKVLLMTFETRMGSAFGPLSLAAHQITYSLWRFLITLCDPIMQASQALVPAHLAAGTPAGRRRARSLGSAAFAVAALFGVVSGAAGLLLSTHAPFWFTASYRVASEAAGLAVPVAVSVLSLAVWHCNEGLMLASGRAKLLSALYIWNVTYFTVGSTVILRRGLTLFHSWTLFASMHLIFASLVSVVLRLPGGVLHGAAEAVKGGGD